jgi:hypothetical protein
LVQRPTGRIKRVELPRHCATVVSAVFGVIGWAEKAAVDDSAFSVCCAQPAISATVRPYSATIASRPDYFSADVGQWQQRRASIADCGQCRRSMGHSIGWFDAFRDNGGPTWYGDNRTPVVVDTGTFAIVAVFAIFLLAFLIIMPGIRRQVIPIDQ